MTLNLFYLESCFVFCYNSLYHDSSIKILTYFILNCRTRKKDSSNRQLSQTTFKQFFIIYKESEIDCSEDVEVCNVLKIRERDSPPFRSFPPVGIRATTRGRQRRQIQTESFYQALPQQIRMVRRPRKEEQFRTRYLIARRADK